MQIVDLQIYQGSCCKPNAKISLISKDIVLFYSGIRSNLYILVLSKFVKKIKKCLKKLIEISVDKMQTDIADNI